MTRSADLIVIIDDMPSHRLVAGHALRSLLIREESKGHKIDVIYPGSPEAVRSIDTSQVSLVISDRIMPEDWRNARQELFDRLKLDRPDVEIVEWSVASRLDQDAVLKEANAAIEKFTGKELVSIISKWLEHGTVCEPNATVK